MTRTRKTSNLASDLARIEKARQDLAGLRRVRTAAERRMQRQFAAATAQVRAARSRIATLSANNSFEGIVSAVITPYTVIADSLVDAYVDGARELAEKIGQQIGQPVPFDITAQSAVNDLRILRTRFMDEFALTTAENVRNAVLTALRDGVDPRTLAERIVAAAGLHPRQEAAVQNYRRLLEDGSREALRRTLRDRRFDSAVDAAARGARSLTAAQIDRMVERYRDRYRRHRALGMAQAAAQSAVNAGRHRLLSQLTEGGTLALEQIERTWGTVGDEDVRDSHEAMAGQVRGLNEPFISGAGVPLMYPGDPSAPASETANCRCGLAVTIRTG